MSVEGIIMTSQTSKIILQLVILLLFIGTLIQVTPIQVRGEGTGWIKINDKPVDKLVLYDIDNDGTSEIVASNFILDGNSIIPLKHSEIYKLDYNGDGKLDLIQYIPDIGKLYVVVNGVTKTYETQVNGTVYFYGNGLQIGRHVYGYNKEILLPVDTMGIPVNINGKVEVVYIDKNGIELYDGLKSNIIYPISPSNTIVSAGYNTRTNEILILVKSQNNTGLILGYNTSTTTTSIRILNNDINVGYYVNGSFIILSDGIVLKATLDKTETITSGERLIYPENSTDEFVVISPSIISIYKLDKGKIEIVKSIPTIREVKYIDVQGTDIVASTDDGIYYYGSKVPEVDVHAPSIVTVGETFTVEVNGTFQKAYVSLDTNSFILSKPKTIKMTVSTIGRHVLSVKACEGSYCITSSQIITAKPRPLSIDIEAPDSVEPYKQFPIKIHVYDSLSHSPPSGVSCTIKTLGDGRSYILTSTDGTVNLTAIPVGLEVPVQVSCSGLEYGVVNKTVSIPVSSYYYDVKILYEGGGKIKLYAYNKYTNEPFKGIIQVSVDNSKPVIVPNKGEFIVSPGTHNVTVKLVKNGVTYGVFSYKVKYYSNIDKAPPSEPIIVGDRVEQVTKYINKTKTVPVVKPVTVTKVNTPVILAVLILGLGIGLVTSYAIPSGLVKRRWRKKKE